MAGRVSHIKPNAAEYNPDPKYLKELIDSTGLSHEALGVIIGVDRRTVDRWISGNRQISYAHQFALEVLVLEPD